MAVDQEGSDTEFSCYLSMKSFAATVDCQQNTLTGQVLYKPAPALYGQVVSALIKAGATCVWAEKHKFTFHGVSTIVLTLAKALNSKGIQGWKADTEPDPSASVAVDAPIEPSVDDWWTKLELIEGDIPEGE